MQGWDLALSIQPKDSLLASELRWSLLHMQKQHTWSRWQWGEATDFDQKEITLWPMLCVSKAEEGRKTGQFRCCFSEGRLKKGIEERVIKEIFSLLWPCIFQRLEITEAFWANIFLYLPLRLWHDKSCGPSIQHCFAVQLAFFCTNAFWVTSPFDCSYTEDQVNQTWKAEVAWSESSQKQESSCHYTNYFIAAILHHCAA